MSTSCLTEGLLRGIEVDPDLTVSEWADEHRMLSQKASAEPGRWRTQRTPYLREIMDDLSPGSPVMSVAFMAGAQVGKTETGNNWLGFIMHHAPGPAMMVQPTVDTAKRVSKQRLAPMLEESPALRGLVRDNRSRDSGNTQLSKEFPGGILIIAGANSAVGLRSMPVRYLFCDEIDGYPMDVDGEGDPIQLAEKRTTTFARRKIFKCSTPTIRDVSRIEREFLAGDQRRFYVPCPHCEHMQWLRWANMKWDRDEPQTAAYACEACGVLIEERFKPQMLAGGEWRPTAECADRRIRSYHLSSLYSPLGWKSWADIVAEFLAAKGDAPSLKTWVNTVLGETWEEEYAARVDADGLMSRMELYKPGVAPAAVLAITAGVDVQDNRIAIVIIGWGESEESWRISHQEIHGDPAKPEVWLELDKALDAIEHALGVQMPIAAVAIDSGGHFTHQVYQFARERRRWHVLAIKGQSQRNKPAIGKPSKVDLNWKGQTVKGGAEVYPVGTDTIKSVIYGRLKFNEPGPGYYHFHDGLSAEYFEQLTSEKLVTRYTRGFPVREWTKKPGARNEALDCEVYAYAALQWVYTRHNRKTVWQTLRARLDEAVAKLSPAKPDAEHEKPAVTVDTERKAAPKIAVRRRGWVNKW